MRTVLIVLFCLCSQVSMACTKDQAYLETRVSILLRYAGLFTIWVDEGKVVGNTLQTNFAALARENTPASFLRDYMMTGTLIVELTDSDKCVAKSNDVPLKKIPGQL